MSPDPGLLAAVEATGIYVSLEVTRSEVLDVLAAAGRVLADLVRERQADIDRAQNDALEGGFGRYAELLAAQAAALGELADVWLPRWCGVEPR